MKNLAGLAFVIGAALFAGCGGSQPPIRAPGAMAMHPELGTPGSPLNLARRDADGGKYPQAPLIDVGGILYGTTNNGGAFRGRRNVPRRLRNGLQHNDKRRR